MQNAIYLSCSIDVSVYVFVQPDFAGNSLFVCYSASKRVI